MENLIVFGILTGLITGICSGMLGIGGGAIMVAIAVAYMDIPQHIAQGAALAAMIPTALVAVLKHRKAGLIHKEVAKQLVIFGILGSLIGSSIANNLDEIALGKVFSIFFLIIGIRMMLPSKENK